MSYIVPAGTEYRSVWFDDTEGVFVEEIGVFASDVAMPDPLRIDDELCFYLRGGETIRIRLTQMLDAADAWLDDVFEELTA